MKTLDDAWKWYTDVKKSLQRIARMGHRYWGQIPWDQPPWQSDRHFADLTQEAVVEAADYGAEHLDDLAVVVLFSVFEANVRQALLDQVKAEQEQSQHRAITEAIETAKEKIGEGSFYAVLSSFKGTDNNLIEQVNQVRKYRNWVSHGRRGAQPPLVAPRVAFDRLTRCLLLLFPAIPEEWVAVGRYYAWETEATPGARDIIYWNEAKVKLQEMVRTGQLHAPSPS